VNNYFTDSLLYQNSHKTDENPNPEDLDSGNEAETELEPEKECLWELNSHVTCIDKLNFNNIANVEGEWFINENLDLTYLSALVSDFVPSDTSTDVNSDFLSAIDALTSLHAPVRSSFMVREKTSNAQGSFFEVPAKHNRSQFYLEDLSLS